MWVVFWVALRPSAQQLNQERAFQVPIRCAVDIHLDECVALLATAGSELFTRR
jgi:hypothetical protein